MRRQYEIEARAARLIGAISEPCVVCLDDGAADREPETGARGLRGEEWLEDPLLELRSQTRSKIADRDFDVARVRRTCRDAHLEGGAHLLGSVVVVALRFECV